MAFDLHPILDRDVSPRQGMWYAVAPEGAAPTARVGATAIQAMEAGSVFVCAGAAPEGAFSDLHQLQIDPGSGISWTSLPSAFLPPRYEHTLALTPEGSLLVFAGAQENGPLHDLWTYDRGAGEWHALEGVKGEIPPPRTHHSSSCTWRDKLIVFSGGSSGTNTLNNSVHFFDIVSRNWMCPPVSGTPPTPRQGHISAVVNDTLYIHGGMTSGGDIHSDLHALNLEDMEWSPVVTKGNSPPALAAHGCAVIENSIYVFGGLTETGATDALHCFDTETLLWDLVKTSGAVPPCRLDHAMTTITLPLLSPHNSSNVTSSQASHRSHVTTSPTSLPHLVTVVAPETLDSERQGTVSRLEQQITDSGKDGACNGDSELFSNDDLSVVVTTPDGAITPLSGRDCSESECVSFTESHATEDCDKVVDEKQRNLQNSEVIATGLVVFGGMDTSGHMHSDCFIIVPPLL